MVQEAEEFAEQVRPTESSLAPCKRTTQSASYARLSAAACTTLYHVC